MSYRSNAIDEGPRSYRNRTVLRLITAFVLLALTADFVVRYTGSVGLGGLIDVDGTTSSMVPATPHTDLRRYYDELTSEEDRRRDVNDVNTLAVHRWLGRNRSTTQHYELVRDAVQKFSRRAGERRSPREKTLSVLDAGCGLGAGLVYFEQTEPTWDLVGVTLSSAQFRFVKKLLGEESLDRASTTPGGRHAFRAYLCSFDDLDSPEQSTSGAEGRPDPPVVSVLRGKKFDVIYAIESLVHSPDLRKTLKHWSDHLASGGVVVVIDDFLTVEGKGRDGRGDHGGRSRGKGAVSVSSSSSSSTSSGRKGAGKDEEDPDISGFRAAWILPSLTTLTDFQTIAAHLGFEIVDNRDIGQAYHVVELNYNSIAPPPPQAASASEHQAWRGTVFRQRAMVFGKLEYRMLVLKKPE